MFGIYALAGRFVQLPASTGYGFGESVTVAGWLLVPLLVTMSVTGVLSARIASVVAYKAQLVVASGMSVLGAASLAWFQPVAVAGGALGIGFRLRLLGARQPLIVQNVPAHRKHRWYERQRPDHRREALRHPGE